MGTFPRTCESPEGAAKGDRLVAPNGERRGAGGLFAARDSLSEPRFASGRRIALSGKAALGQAKLEVWEVNSVMWFSLLVLIGLVVVVALVVALLIALTTRRSRSTASQNPHLRPCPDCGHAISVRANSCPHCGGPVKSA